MTKLGSAAPRSRTYLECDAEAREDGAAAKLHIRLVHEQRGDTVASTYVAYTTHLKTQGYILCKIYSRGGGDGQPGKKMKLGVRKKMKKGKEKRRKITLKKGKEALKMHLLGL